MAAQLHVINKRNIHYHYVLSLDTSALPTQAPGTIRCRTLRIGLTSNNITYARLGAELGWWQTYPVPSYLPPPYNDPSAWGIVPAWGIAKVISSNLAGHEADSILTPGTHLYGLFPPTTLPVDLSLTPAAPSGHFTETTPHRQNPLALYKHYIALASPPIPQDQDEIARSTLIRPLYECAHLLNTVLLSPAALSVHPSGDASIPWPRENADLSKTVMVILGASGTTARCTTDALLHARGADKRPTGVLRVCREPENLAPVDQGVGCGEYWTTDYAEATAPTTLASLAGSKAERVLVLDFGAPGNETTNILSALCAEFQDVPVSCITIGAPPPSSPSKTSTAAVPTPIPSIDRAEKSRMNTSAVRSQALTLLGPETYYDRLERAWREFLARGALEGFEVEKAVGVRRFAEGWEQWCRGRGQGTVVSFERQG